MAATARKDRRRYHFLLSSFNSEEKAKLSLSIQELGGTYLDTPNFVRSCSHVICGKPNRGEKFLCGCASGKWILKKDFLEDSIKAGKWLSEEMYEWNEQSTVTGLSVSHMTAPGRWRRILQQKRGPFEGWKVLVAVADAKKRAAYKRLLEVGCAVIVTGKPPYKSSLASKLTHVFVEKALENDIQTLQAAGVQCLSPDYIPEFILQDPFPPPAAFLITFYQSPVKQPAIARLQRAADRLKHTPVLGINTVVSRVVEEDHLHASSTTCTRKTRPPSESLCTSESPRKKQKQDPVNHEALDFSCVDKWKAVSTLSGSLSNTSKVCAGEFPGYVMNSIDGYLEESHQSTVLDVIQSFMTYKRYPPSSLLLKIMDNLMKSQCHAQVTKAFILLQRLLVLHAPSENSSLYQPTISLHTDADGTSVGGLGCEWEFIKTLCSTRDESSLLLLRYVITVLERDFHERTSTAGWSSTSEHLNSLKESLLWRMFWLESSGISFNMRLRELFSVTWNAACGAVDDPTQIPVLHTLQSLVMMTSQCHIHFDLHSMKCTKDSLGSRLSEQSRTYVTELAFGGLHRGGACLKRFLETCSSTWLKMHVTEMLLANYSDSFVPLERRPLKLKALSLEKIIFYYFLLVPSTPAASPVTKGVRRRGAPLQDIGVDNAQNGSHNSLNVVTGSNRRNVRGETKLHVSCIKNDAVKVKQLLAAGADANSTDHAGWTPLHEACNHGNVECVRELLKARQPVFGINPGDDTFRVLDLLSAPKCGTTPLHDAAGNNHLNVIQLLITAGGLPLLQAKNALGQKPLNVSRNEKVKEFLQTMENNNTVNSTFSDTNEVLSQVVPKHTSQECEEYTLILSHLIQSYFRMTRAAADNWTNFAAHVDTLESHVTRMFPDKHLCSVISIRLAAMRMLAGY